MGVVYAPMIDTMYYGTVGKGAYSQMFKTPPRQLGSKSALGQRLLESRPRFAGSLEAHSSKSKAVSMFLIAAGYPDPTNKIENSMEWQTAAAHAIIAAAGLKVELCNRAEELTYNKETFINECFSIK